MTKLKNTKKGMAKKALSISLVAAMLATSNVPVWAAEFSDGTDAAPVVIEESADVEAFSAEEAPVAEEVVETADLQAAVESSTDFSANVSFSGVTNNSVVWDNTVTATINSFTNADTNPNSSKSGYGVYYAWKIDNTAGSENYIGSVGEIIDGQVGNINAFTPDSEDVGKSITFYLAVKDNNGNTVWTYNSDAILVKPQDLTDRMSTDITISSDWNPVYNGKAQVITKDDIVFTNFDASKFDITVSGDTTNVTDQGVTVTVTRNDGAYVGTKVLNYKINPLTLDGTTGHMISENLAATLITTDFTYTGNVIRVKASDVTLTDKNTNADLSNYLKADSNGYVSLEKISAQNAGETTFRLNLITGQPETGIKNYDIAATTSASDVDGYRTIETTNKATIKARDLSTVNVSIKAQSIPANGVINLTENDITFTDKTTNEKLNLFDEIDISAVKDVTAAGTYSVQITPKASNENITGSATASFNVVAADISGARFNGTEVTTAEEYTGEAVTKTAKQLGSLVLDGKVVDASEYTIVYENNVNAGTAKIIVQGKNSFAGSQAEFTFTINPATVTADTITYAKDGVEYIDTNNASDYKDAMGIVVKAKNADGKEFTLEENVDYAVKYEFDGGNVVDTGKVKATITVTNKNFLGGSNEFVKEATITSRAIKSENIKLKESSFTYTGKAVTPEFDVVVDGKIINPALYTYEFTNNINAGTATLTVKGTNATAEGSGDKRFSTAAASITFTISPANAADLVGVIATEQYRGYSIEVPADGIDLTLNGNAIDVASNFTLTYGENTNIGEGTVTLTPKNGNFTGTKTLTFTITGELLKSGGTFKFYDENGIEVNANDAFEYDGTAHTFGKVVFTYGDTTKTLVEGTDYDLVYVDNIYGKESENGQLGAVLAVAKGKYGSNISESTTVGTTGLLNGIYTDAEGNKITNVIAVGYFGINSLEVNRNSVSLSNGVYAGGLPVKPDVSITIKGVKLVEGQDYDLYIPSNYDTVNATTTKSLQVQIQPKNGYSGDWDNLWFDWGIDKFDLANADVTVEDGKVVVKCGRVDVETSEYTVTTNAEDGTTTVTAVAASKNYTGSKTIRTNGTTEDEKPATPMIVDVQVTGNNAKVILSGECDGATGYDYVISTDRDCITNKDYDKVNKNILTTNTTFTYTQQGTYYAYCHAWKRVNGVKVFSEWSNAYPFVVSSITPEQPGITSVKVSGSTVKVTYTQCANATGYDIVLGSAVKKVNGESRPVEYGTLVKKVKNGTTVTATFKNVPKGTYYAGLHAYNRTSEDGKKVFSPWSNTKKVTVK